MKENERPSPWSEPFDEIRVVDAILPLLEHHFRHEPRPEDRCDHPECVVRAVLES